MKHCYQEIILILVLITSNPVSALSALQEETNLVAGLKVERTLTSSLDHIYTAELKNGSAIIAEILQESIDVVIDIFAPNGIHIKQIDGSNEIELIDIISNQTGKYTVVVHPYEKGAKPGKYLLEVNNILTLEENVKRIAKQEIPSKTLYELWEYSLTNKNAIDSFMNRHKERHIIEPIEGNESDLLVTYFCVPDDDTEYAMQSGGPDFLGLRFRKLGDKKLQYTTHVVPKDARFNYGFNYFKIHHAGPNGEVEFREMEHVYDGTVVMPNAPKQPYITEIENVKKGKLLSTSIISDILNEDRKITVHTPSGYEGKSPHNLLIIFDGEDYGAIQGIKAEVPTPTILDNLSAENKIRPTITVLVWNLGNRDKDLISKNFADFVAKELVPWARLNYNIHPEADKVIVAGSSRGGFAASFIALNHSNIIGNVISQSGSYWIKGTSDENHWMYPKDEGKLITAFKNSPRLPIKFYIDVGLYDAGASMLGMNRELRDILEIKGYDLDYKEFKGGHSYSIWRGTLSDGLISILGLEKK
jgi:enterochelin esterase-like enzyme